MTTPTPPQPSAEDPLSEQLCTLAVGARLDAAFPLGVSACLVGRCSRALLLFDADAAPVAARLARGVAAHNAAVARLVHAGATEGRDGDAVARAGAGGGDGVGDGERDGDGDSGAGSDGSESKGVPSQRRRPRSAFRSEGDGAVAVSRDAGRGHGRGGAALRSAGAAVMATSDPTAEAHRRMVALQVPWEAGHAGLGVESRALRQSCAVELELAGLVASQLPRPFLAELDAVAAAPWVRLGLRTADDGTRAAEPGAGADAAWVAERVTRCVGGGGASDATSAVSSVPSAVVVVAGSAALQQEALAAVRTLGLPREVVVLL